MDGIEFYSHLRNNLIIHQNLSTNYTFQGWDHHGKLKYNVDNSTIQPRIKTIPLEILVVAKYWFEKDIVITHAWLVENGHDNYCTPPVLNYLLTNYNI